MIIITGTVVARPETLEELLAVSLEHVHRSREEPGCLSHDVYTHAENPLRLFFFETWADQAAVNAHFAVPESRSFVKAVNLLAAEASAIGVYKAEPTTG